MILAIRTDKPAAELYLVDKDSKVIDKKIWLADRALSGQLLKSIETLINKPGHDFHDLEGIVVYRGPGSFTGLRIGIATANSLAYAYNLPITGASGSNWLNQAVKKQSAAKAGRYISPLYGAPPRISQPKR